MEKEKTAEEERPIWQEVFDLNNEVYHGGDQLQNDILKAQEIEKLVIRVAEQARREERERHVKLVQFAKDIMEVMLCRDWDDWEVEEAKEALAAAGYKGEEEQ